MNDNMTSNPAKTVLFVVFPNVKLLDLAGPMQVFADTTLRSTQVYDIVVASFDGGTVSSDAHLPVETVVLSKLRNLDIDTLIVAGGPGAFAASENANFRDEVQHLAAQSRRVGSVCTGAFILAKAGLLDGRRVVTHWEYCDLFHDSFDEARVEEDAIFIKDGNIWTSAGVTAGIDMSLAMVTEDVGRKAALEVAQSLVCYLVRPGGQSQFSTTLKHQYQTSSGRFDELNAWIADNLTAPLSVDDLANQAAMSPRHFARLYTAQTGATPAKAVEAIRLKAACLLLEETDMPLGMIVKQCGFADSERLRRAMMRSFKVAPGAYRKRFGQAQANIKKNINSGW
ncbi:GlxA family transcriptional regulator [Rhodophyticola sp. SM2404]